MSKKKTIIISVIIFLVLSLLIATLCGINYYNKGMIDFKIDDTLESGNGKKAKVIILAGQSNAAGCSEEEYLERNVTEDKYQ